LDLRVSVVVEPRQRLGVEEIDLIVRRPGGDTLLVETGKVLLRRVAVSHNAHGEVADIGIVGDL
jgi:hypothetical protein